MPRCLLLLVVAGALAAQERAAKWRPVPGLASAQPLPVLLPPMPALAGASAVFTARGVDLSMLCLRNGDLHETPIRPAPPLGVSRPAFQDAARCSLQIGDFDGDGSEEVLARLPSQKAFVRTVATPRQSAWIPLRAGDGAWFSGCAFDWFGDGCAALVFVDGSRVVAAQRVFAMDTRLEPLVDLGDAKILAGTAGDFDLDGLPDLVLVMPDRGFVWCRHEGTRTEPRFSAPIPLWPADPGVVVTSVLLFPIDDDPWPDLVVGSAMRAFDGHSDFSLREPRTTDEIEQATRALENQPAAGANTESTTPGLLDRGNTQPPLPALLGRNTGDNPFAKLLEVKNRQDRIEALRWREIPMTARAPVVHYRSKAR
jgi:hypothetical protein